MYTPAIEDYLKTIYELQGEQGQVATTTLAERLGVAPASVTNMVKKLAEMGLVVHQPYYGLRLTERGQQCALKVLRCHRLVELFLVKSLGLAWDQVHVEAEKWEHVLSEEMTERMAAVLGQPLTDPHGAPIPARDGTLIEPIHTRLVALRTGQSAHVTKVSDHNPALLRYLGELGLYPGAEVQVVGAAPFTDSVTVRLGALEHTLGHEAAQHVFVTRVMD